MKFTDENPTVPGAYWVRHESLDRPALIEVHEFDGDLWCNLHQRTTFSLGDREYGYTVQQLDPDFEWCGPLTWLSEEDAQLLKFLKRNMIEQRAIEKVFACADDEEEDE